MTWTSIKLTIIGEGVVKKVLEVVLLGVWMFWLWTFINAERTTQNRDTKKVTSRSWSWNIFYLTTRELSVNIKILWALTLVGPPWFLGNSHWLLLFSKGWKPVCVCVHSLFICAKLLLPDASSASYCTTLC